jgi:pyruvate,orthophosphate dikinase
MVASRQIVLSFNDGTSETRTPAFRGGKGAGLASMVDLGLPVPPGFTLGTGVARAFMQHGCLPVRVLGQLKREIAKLERCTGKTFGDAKNPLLVSVRSGAEVSMPGMMDTILNVGFPVGNLSGLFYRGGERFVQDIRVRFTSQWRQSFPGLAIPSDPFVQLQQAVIAVLESWTSERAVVYRKHHNISNNLGTAVTVQAMVFGNINQKSCTGVVFSANVATGEQGLYGEFLPQAQGEDVVSGVRTPLALGEMKAWDSQVYMQLKGIVERLAVHYGSVVDVEFTVEDGELYILQVRKAKLSPQAQVVHSMREYWAGRCSRKELLHCLSSSEVALLWRPAFHPEAQALARVVGSGLAASPGAANGIVATTSAQAQEMAANGSDVILVREDTSPEDLPGMMVAKAIVTRKGGKTCHAAVVARELGLPAIVGVSPLVCSHLEGKKVAVDGAAGVMYDGHLPTVTPTLPKEVSLFLKWQESYQPQVGFNYYGRTLSVNKLLNDFYLTQAMETEAEGSPLQRDVSLLRVNIHREVAESFALYLLIATIGEARHYRSHTKGGADLTMEVIFRHIRLYDDQSREATHDLAVQIFKEKTSQFIADFMADVVRLFTNGDWARGYGGASWARIAQALVDFLTGALSPTVFVDHVFDLQHNGGCLFDKNPMFVRASDEDDLKLQLDIKKSSTCITELFRKLREYGQPSDEVLHVWGLGKSESLW